MHAFNAFVEGDQIHVIAASGHQDNAVYALTSLEGISIFKV